MGSQGGDQEVIFQLHSREKTVASSTATEDWPQISFGGRAKFLLLCWLLFVRLSSVCGTGHALCFTSNNDNNK